MAQDTISPPAEGQSMTDLVNGILRDAQELVRQQFDLVRVEIKAEFRQAVRAAVLLAVGSLVLVPAAFLLCNMLVYMLVELAGLRVWASYGIVGGVFAVLGAVLILVGVQRFRSVKPLPDQSVEAIKENVRWMTNPK
jgi:uncharacterized membrane protein YqjE